MNDEVTDDEAAEQLEANRQTVASLVGHPTQQVERLSNGRVRISFRIPALAPVVSWVLEWGPQAVPIAPDALVAQVRRELDEARAARLTYCGRYARRIVEGPTVPSFAVGDIYEDCSYHPVRCERVDGDEISGVSLIDGSRPRGCSLGHCGVIKLTEAEAQQRIAAFNEEGERGLMRFGGLTEAQIDELLRKRR